MISKNVRREKKKGKRASNRDGLQVLNDRRKRSVNEKGRDLKKELPSSNHGTVTVTVTDRYPA